MSYCKAVRNSHIEIYCYMLSFLLGKYLGEGWLGHMIYLFSVRNLSTYGSKWLYHFRFPSAVPVALHPCQHLVGLFIYLSHSHMSYLLMVLICISLMTNAIKQLIMCLLSFYISTLIKYLFKSIFLFLTSCPLCFFGHTVYFWQVLQIPQYIIIFALNNRLPFKMI